MSNVINTVSPVQPRAVNRRLKAVDGKDRRLEATVARLSRAERACMAAFAAVGGWGAVTYENAAAWLAYAAAVKARTPHQRRAVREARRAFR
jgi:hypothetical protein